MMSMLLVCDESCNIYIQGNKKGRNKEISRDQMDASPKIS